MKMWILCLSFLMSVPALAERTAGNVESTSSASLTGTSDAISEAASVQVNVACKTGSCPLPVNIKPASIMDPIASKNYVEWVVNGATGTPPALDASEGTR